MFNIIALSWAFVMLCKCIYMLTFIINKLLQMLSLSVLAAVHFIIPASVLQLKALMFREVTQ